MEYNKNRTISRTSLPCTHSLCSNATASILSLKLYSVIIFPGIKRSPISLVVVYMDRIVILMLRNSPFIFIGLYRITAIFLLFSFSLYKNYPISASSFLFLFTYLFSLLHFLVKTNRSYDWTRYNFDVVAHSRYIICTVYDFRPVKSHSTSYRSYEKKPSSFWFATPLFHQQLQKTVSKKKNNT